MFKLIQDSREQTPLEFKTKDGGGIFDEIVIECLPYGDYACEMGGLRLPLVFERKSLGDLFGTLGKGIKRFKREVDRARVAGVELRLVVEDSYGDVLNGTKHSMISGRSILRTLATFDIKYGLRYWCFENRKESAMYIEETFGAISRNYERMKKGLQ
jgi:ERCC4-type nuclease